VLGATKRGGGSDTTLEALVTPSGKLLGAAHIMIICMAMHAMCIS
jgi:hypothetical protein